MTCAHLEEMMVAKQLTVMSRIGAFYKRACNLTKEVIYMLMGIAYLLLIIGTVAKYTIWRPIGITAGIVWSLASLVVGARYWPMQLIHVFFFWLNSLIIGYVIQRIIKKFSKEKKENHDPDSAYKPLTNKVEPLTNKVEPFTFKRFFLDRNYRKFAYRLLGSISGVIFIIFLILEINNDAYYRDPDRGVYLFIGCLSPLVVFGLYHLIRWILKAFPDTLP